MIQVISINYGPGRPVVLQIRGHLTEAVCRGHNIMSEILGEGRWRIASCTYSPPSADRYASDGVVEMMAVRIT